MAEARTIMHIDADAFFASVEQGFNPLLRGRPVIVGGLPNQRGVVHTASYEARAWGVHTGMPLGRARALCPQAVFLKGDYEHYRAVSQLLQEVYLRYTPLVEFTSLDDAYLDFSGALHLYESPRTVAVAIQKEVKERTGVSVSIGIGSSKMIARIASGLKKPGGILEVPAGKEKDFLWPLPVDTLPGIGRRAGERLQELGIFRVGELAALPMIVLEQLFGRNGRKLWQLANACDDRPVEPKIVPKQLSRETSFEEDTADEALVKGTIQYLCERLGRKLREQHLWASSLGIKIKYSDFRYHTTSRLLPEPTHAAAKLYEQAVRLFEQLRLRRMRIRLVGVMVAGLEREYRQRTLFTDEEEEQIGLTRAIETIRKKYGFMAILPADTLVLKSKYRMDSSGYILHNPALTR